MNQNNPMGNTVERLGSAAVSSWKAASDNGWGEGQILLGLCYQFGIHVDKDLAKGRTLIRKAADQGIGLAEFCLAVDIDTQRNPELKGEMVKWMLGAAEHGIPRAQGTVAQWYLDGTDTVPKDVEKAVQWFKRAAENGDSWSQHQLAVFYYMGIQVNKDMDEAVKWIRLAADNGEVESQYVLGNMYFAGEGVPQNLTEAARWCRKAADQGLAKAQTTLGAMYLDGSGVPRDVGKAQMWFRLAAQQGDETAIANLRALNNQAGNAVQGNSDRRLPANGREARVEWITVPCPNCDGTGYRQGLRNADGNYSRMRCITCGGTGKIRQQR